LFFGHVLLKLRESPLEVDGVASEFEVDVGIPDLFGFIRREFRLSLALDSLISFLVHEFEDVLVPENTVLYEASVA